MSTHTVKSPEPTPTAVPVSWLREGKGYSETQTFYFFPTTGGFCYIQLAYSEVSVTALTQITVYINTPAFSLFKSSNFSGSSLQVHPDNAGSTCAGYSVTQNDDKWVIALKNADIVANIQVVLPVTVHVGDAKILFTQKDGGSKPDGFLATTYAPTGTATGVMMSSGVSVDVSGNAILVHQYQGIAPHKIANQWNFLSFVSPKICLASVSGITPSTYNHEHFGTLAVDVQGHGTLVANKVDIHFGSLALDPSTNYSVPKQFTMSATLSNGFTLKASGGLDMSIVNKIDILGELPWLIRKAVKYFMTNPFVYQFFDKNFNVSVLDAQGQVVAEESGVGMFEISFTNRETN